MILNILKGDDDDSANAKLYEAVAVRLKSYKFYKSTRFFGLDGDAISFDGYEMLFGKHKFIERK